MQTFICDFTTFRKLMLRFCREETSKLISRKYFKKNLRTERIDVRNKKTKARLFLIQKMKKLRLQTTKQNR